MTTGVGAIDCGVVSHACPPEVLIGSRRSYRDGGRMAIASRVDRPDPAKDVP